MWRLPSVLVGRGSDGLAVDRYDTIRGGGHIGFKYSRHPKPSHGERHRGPGSKGDGSHCSYLRSALAVSGSFRQIFQRQPASRADALTWFGIFLNIPIITALAMFIFGIPA